jgi:hypothetical protein
LHWGAATADVAEAAYATALSRISIPAAAAASAGAQLDVDGTL